MKTYVLGFINRLKRKTIELDVQATLCGKKWLIFNDNGEKKTVKFRENGTVIISTNGME